MKARLKHVPNKLGRNDTTRAKLKKQGAVSFDELRKILSTGETNVVLLDLTGKPVPVDADAIGTRRVRRKKQNEKLTKFERTLRSFMEANDIEPEEVTGLALIVGESYDNPNPRPAYYKPITL